jgi:hypothetical protein
MEVLKTLKGGSLSSTKVIWDGNEKFVRKTISTKNNREYGMVRWQSQIRKLQILNKYIPGSSVSIKQVGYCEEYHFYDIPYYEDHLNCYEALLNGESATLIADKVYLLLSKMASIQYEVVKGSLSVYIAEEVLFPLRAALKIVKESGLPLSSEELEFFKESLINAISIVEHLLTKVKDVYMRESLTHGNLTLENILWNNDTKEILMIDPYAETYCESIIGDISQLLQSSKCGYEFISNLYEKRDISIYKYPSDEIPECLNNFSEQLTKKICSENWYSDTYLKLFRASQFTRMFPFKLVNSPRQGVAFMLHGINLLKEI